MGFLYVLYVHGPLPYTKSVGVCWFFPSGVPTRRLFKETLPGRSPAPGTVTLLSCCKALSVSVQKLASKLSKDRGVMESYKSVPKDRDVVLPMTKCSAS